MKFDLRVIFCAFITWLNSINILLYNLGVFSFLEVFPREKLDLNYAGSAMQLYCQDSELLFLLLVLLRIFKIA